MISDRKQRRHTREEFENERKASGFSDNDVSEWTRRIAHLAPSAITHDVDQLEPSKDANP